MIITQQVQRTESEPSPGIGRRLGLPSEARHRRSLLKAGALPDVTLKDIHLPGISGTAARRRLAGDSGTCDIPVNALPRDIEKGLEAGFSRYLTKPIRVGPFMDTLDLALHASSTRATHR